MLTVTNIDEKTWVFDEGGVRFFLLAGDSKALLIDSGMQTHNALELAQKRTSLPIELLNTHADMDHTGSNSEFGKFYMSLAECSNYYHSGKSGEVIPVHGGDTIDLGNRPLHIIELPGHTPGSIAVLDTLNRRLFSGDPVQDGKIFMFGVQRELHAYVHSLAALETQASEFDMIFPSHGSYPLEPSIIPKLREAAQKILCGDAEEVEESLFGNKIVAYNMDVATFLCDAK